VSVGLYPELDAAPGAFARTATRVRLLSRGSWRLGVGAFVVGVCVVAALAAPLISPHDPLAAAQGHELQGPSLRFPLGTDELGRDILSRIIYGTRPSLVIGFLACAIAMAGGVTTGLLAGYRGGWLDSALMRAWSAALVGGATGPKIVLRHILPNAFAPLLVQATVVVGIAVLVAAGLSFLGLGTQPPTPSWGGMVAEARPYLGQSVWFALFPGTAISVLVLGLNLLADGLRDLFDPRRGER
jgi:peptide/nickel transport system permease protein